MPAPFSRAPTGLSEGAGRQCPRVAVPRFKATASLLRLGQNLEDTQDPESTRPGAQGESPLPPEPPVPVSVHFSMFDSLRPLISCRFILSLN